MNYPREITVFTIGDSNELKTWSNVPYFFSRSLEDRGIRINRVDLSENRILSFLYRYSAYVLLKLFYKEHHHNYFRSGLNYFLTNRRIKKAVRQYSQSDVFLFLTYSFSAKKYTNKKTVLFSDWSYSYLIESLRNRSPYWFEKKALGREKRHIRSADDVIGLFPKSHAYTSERFKVSNSHYLGNVINANSPALKELPLKKITSQKLLFIGNRKYLKGARQLCQVFKDVLKKHPQAELHLIGMDAGEAGINSGNIFFHGYLDKGKKDQNERYYKLLSEARMIVNTHPGWGAFSAVTEAMFFYTPVVTTPYSEFTETYGTAMRFGKYVQPENNNELLAAINELLEIPEESIREIMLEANRRVRDFTWENFTDNFLKLIA